MEAVAACLLQLLDDDENNTNTTADIALAMDSDLCQQKQNLLLLSGATSVIAKSRHGCVDRFYETVIPSYSALSFHSHFRMQRNTMEVLCDELRPHLIAADKNHNYIPSDKKVHMAVWYLSSQEVYRSVGNLFGMPSKSTAQYCIMQVCTAITRYLRQNYIQWPLPSEYSTVASGFEANYGFPNVIGCIDGTHIPVKAPALDRDSFINRKGYPSINVMAVCNDQMVFTDVFAERAGSVHDARVLRVSPLSSRLEQSDPTFHLLGDSAYPLSPQLLVPYRDNGHLTPTQTKFNVIHSETRSIVERSFARLKGKFRHLRGLECTSIQNSVVVIESCFILHNFILKHEGQNDDDSNDEDNSDVSDTLNENSLCDIGNSLQSDGKAAASAKHTAAKKRDNIAELFC